jgi:tRNA(Ile)-lysidine synthase
MDPLLQRIRQTIHDHQMFENGQILLIAVSGGPDSMALLHIFFQWRESFAIQLCVAHLNHQMRPGAAQDALFVEAAARDLGIPCLCDSIDVPAYQHQHKLSPEDAARRVRYAFLSQAAAKMAAHHIVLGHTADDQAETVLYHLFRGSGLRGLRGMPPVRQPVIRPLIRVQHRDLLAYLRRHRIPFREDPSNQHRRYTRNRLRLDLIPHLQASYNPRLVDTLNTTAELLAADEAVLQNLAQEHFRAARMVATPTEVQLCMARILPLPLALQRRVLRYALAEVLGTLRGISHAHLAHILALLQTQAGTKQLTLPGKAVVERRYDLLKITRQASPAAARADLPVAVPGVCEVKALGVTIISAIIPHEVTTCAFPDGDVAWLDAERVGTDLRVRTRAKGDRFHPLGRHAAKKLKTFLIDAKVARAERDSLPLFVTNAGIAWVGGVRIADWAKVTSATRTILRLQLVRHAHDGVPYTAL